jgi:hypothetical protein
LVWIYAFPAWGVAVTAIVLLAILAGAMVLAARGTLRVHHLQHNDACGAIATVIGAILAVLLSVMLIADWQEYDQAAQTASDEASAAQDLYNASRWFPSPARERLERLVKTYAAAVVHVEWPLMRGGYESRFVDKLTGKITGTVISFEPKTPAETALQSQALGFASAIAASRQIRLFDNQQGIPMILWACIGLLVIVTLMMCAVFSVRNLPIHVVMSASVGAVIAMIVVLIAEFDYPFRGDIQLPPTAWAHTAVGIAKD